MADIGSLAARPPPLDSLRLPAAEPPPPARRKTEPPAAEEPERATKPVEPSAPPPVAAPPRLRIEQDLDSGRYVYISIDAQSGEVIRQYPVQEVLARIAFIRDMLGRLVDRTA